MSTIIVYTSLDAPMTGFALRRHRRFRGRGRHLGSGANAAKFTVNQECMGKIVTLMLHNSRKFDILQFYELQTKNAS